jgi:hypothetical protein
VDFSQGGSVGLGCKAIFTLLNARAATTNRRKQASPTRARAKNN